MAFSTENTSSRPSFSRPIDFEELAGNMKAKTRHRKSGKWRRRADSSPVAKGRRVKIHGTRNPRKRKHLGGKGL
jgi:hypothetical protein